MTDAARQADLERDFEAFYAAYPRHEAKGYARPAYLRAREKKGATHEAIMAGLMRYIRSVAGKEKRFVALPASWLNAERWADEVALPGEMVHEPDLGGQRGLWVTRMRGYRPGGFWPHFWGDRPESGRNPHIPADLNPWAPARPLVRQPFNGD